MEEIGAIVAGLGLDQKAATAAPAVEEIVHGQFQWQVDGKLQAGREELLWRLLPLEPELLGKRRVAAIGADNEARLDRPHGALREDPQFVPRPALDGLERGASPD